MVSAVTGNAEREYDGARGKIKNFGAVELDELRGIFMLASSRNNGRFLDVLFFRPRRPNARRQLPLDPLSLRESVLGAARVVAIRCALPRDLDSLSSKSPW